MLIFKISTLSAFVITTIWAFNIPGYDSISAAVTAFAALAVIFFIDSKNKGDGSGPSQKIGHGSIGIQAGRDANRNKINNE